MTKKLVILGGGTAGTLLANQMRRRIDEADLRIDVVDRDDVHVYQPGLLFVPFGLAKPEHLVRPRGDQLRRGIAYHRAEIEHVALAEQRVHLTGGATLPYDALVVATGARLLPEETDGMLGAAWQRSVFTFYDLPGAISLRDALAQFAGGRLVVDIVDMPIKCPVAPIEFTFLADWYLRRRGIRDRTTLTLATPLDACFTKPVASRHLTHLLEEKGIELETEFAAGEVDGDGGRLVSYDGREIPFDLLVTIPLHGGQAYVDRSVGLGDSLGFIPTDPATLQTKAAEDVFAIGDATDLRASKAGSVAHFEGEILAENIASFLRDEPLTARFDGHANCFVETGNRKALLIDFNDEIEPVPGRFGPLPLLKESRLSHLAKLAFKPVYWHVLLPGHRIPLIGPTMPLRGKRLEDAA
ncbi:MAG: sulfide:quinone oxidoreductase [Gaiellaceae bacterium]|jgi:sulfide:quinone oxidoreductase|nr:sulfide:quinone oxidoreductase [Gaiellaceae bacterium]